MDAAALPPLVGERAEIIAIADERRMEMLDRLAREIASAAGGAPAALVAEMVALYTEVALRQTIATWWLNPTFLANPLAQTVMRLFNAEDKARHTEIRANR